MPKSFRILFILLALFTVIACGSAPSTAQPTGQPQPDSSTLSAPTQPASDASPTRPAAEPSGLKVAFNLNGNIWFWSETTPARQLTTGGKAGPLKLSDDGKVIAYTRDQGLWAINSDGTNARELVADISAFTGHPYLAQFDFQPGAHTVYFSSRESVQVSVGGDLHRVDADSPIPQTLLQQGGYFTFSPDGRLLALADVSRINVLQIDSPALISALDFQKVDTHSDWSFYPQVVWLDNSTGLYTVIPGNGGQKSRFLYIAADGSFTAQLAEFAPADIRVSRPLIAPNGSGVAYITSTEDSFDIHVIDASTADAIIASYPTSPQFGLWTWSPDSVRFTYWTEAPSRLLIAGRSNPPVPLADPIAPYTLTWVDANRFLYFANGELRLGQAGAPVLAVITGGYAEGEQNAAYVDFAP